MYLYFNRSGMAISSLDYEIIPCDTGIGSEGIEHWCCQFRRIIAPTTTQEIRIWEDCPSTNIDQFLNLSDPHNFQPGNINAAGHIFRFPDVAVLTHAQRACLQRGNFFSKEIIDS